MEEWYEYAFHPSYMKANYVQGYMQAQPLIVPLPEMCPPSDGILPSLHKKEKKPGKTKSKRIPSNGEGSKQGGASRKKPRTSAANTNPDNVDFDLNFEVDFEADEAYAWGPAPHASGTASTQGTAQQGDNAPLQAVPGNFVVFGEAEDNLLEGLDDLDFFLDQA